MFFSRFIQMKSSRKTFIFILKAVIKLCGRITPCVVFVGTILFTLQIATRMAIKAGEGTPKIRHLWVSSETLPPSYGNIPQNYHSLLTYVLPASTRPSSTLSCGQSTRPINCFSLGQVHVSWPAVWMSGQKYDFFKQLKVFGSPQKLPMVALFVHSCISFGKSEPLLHSSQVDRHCLEQLGATEVILHSLQMKPTMYWSRRRNLWGRRWPQSWHCGSCPHIADHPLDSWPSSSRKNLQQCKFARCKSSEMDISRPRSSAEMTFRL